MKRRSSTGGTTQGRQKVTARKSSGGSAPMRSAMYFTMTKGEEQDEDDEEEYEEEYSCLTRYTGAGGAGVSTDVTMLVRSDICHGQRANGLHLCHPHQPRQPERDGRQLSRGMLWWRVHGTRSHVVIP